MVPNTAAALPEVTDEGRTYTIKVRPGIRFAADPAFKGKPRELTAEDYVYSFKRIFDPKVRSYWLYVFEGNLVGLDEPLAAARKSGTWDYDAPLEGLRALDRFTLQIRFRRPNYGFEWWLATNQFSAVAREVVDAYKDDLEPGDGESGGHRRLPPEAMDARPDASCSKRIRTIAT